MLTTLSRLLIKMIPILHSCYAAQFFNLEE
jgi:hypothetical protein